jgi:hypothetical protein
MVYVLSEHIVGELTHWADPEHREAILSNNNQPFACTIFNKPVGIWLSWNKGWEKWTESEAPYFLDGKMTFSCKLKPGFKLLLINDMSDFLTIWNEFCNHIGKPINTGSMIWCSEPAIMRAFWKYIKDDKECGGIALTDAGQWATRMNTFLYGWDCQSIVIFDTNNIIYEPYAILIEDKTTEEDTNGKREE